MVPARPALSPAASRSHGFFRRPVFAALVLTAAAVLAYCNSFGVPFVFDDELAIVGNPTIRELGTSWSPPLEGGGLPVSGRPIVNFSMGLNYAIGGLEVWSYHLFNLCVHVSAGLVFFGIIRRTLQQPALAAKFGAHAFELALLTSALWTLHPLQTESVTYISQRAEALVGLCYFLTVWSFIRSTEPGASPRWQWLCVICCLAGMATKEVMVSAPLFLALYDRAFLSSSWREVWQRRRGLLLTLAATWLLLAWFVVRGGGVRGASAGFGLGVSPWTYLLTQCEAIVLYFKLSVWPAPLVLDYGIGLVHSLAEVWWQGLLLCGLVLATLWAVVRHPAWACLGAWFFMILAPSSSIVPLVGQTIAEHRMYLPLAAVVTALVVLAYVHLGRRSLPLLAVLAAALTVVTLRRNVDYQTSIRICEDTVTKRPDNARAMALLADYHQRAGQLEPAKQWLERSLQVQPDVPPVLSNLGNIWQALGNYPKAISYYEQALARRSRDATTLNNLGNALVLSGRVPEGIQRLEAAVALFPDQPGTRANLAAVLAQSGRLPEAVTQFEQLLRLQPDEAETHANFSDVLQAMNRRDEALAQLETAVRLRPNDASLHNRLGAALGRYGRVREALFQFQEALRLDPSLDSARQNAARAQRLLQGS